jgi:hypothetical protein
MFGLFRQKYTYDADYIPESAIANGVMEWANGVHVGDISCPPYKSALFHRDLGAFLARYADDECKVGGLSDRNRTRLAGSALRNYQVQTLASA